MDLPKLPNISVSEYDFTVHRRRVYLNGREIHPILGIDIHIEPQKSPEVLLRIPVNKITIDGYTDLTLGKDEPQSSMGEKAQTD